MPSMNPIRHRAEAMPNPIPFSGWSATHSRHKRHHRDTIELPGTLDDVLAAFDTVSRRITDLARELNCLGYFDDPNGDLPRAA